MKDSECWPNILHDVTCGADMIESQSSAPSLRIRTSLGICTRAHFPISSPNQFGAFRISTSPRNRSFPTRHQLGHTTVLFDPTSLHCSQIHRRISPRMYCLLTFTQRAFSSQRSSKGFRVGFTTAVRHPSDSRCPSPSCRGFSRSGSGRTLVRPGGSDGEVVCASNG